MILFPNLSIILLSVMHFCAVIKKESCMDVNLALKQENCIDYILVSPGCDVSEFSVVDPDIIFSDHLPLYVAMKCSVSKLVDKSRGQTIITQRQLRWDKADSVSYYYYTCLLYTSPSPRD